MTSLLKRLATIAINWDIGQHSALGTQEPQRQVPSLHLWWFKRMEAAHTSQPTCHGWPSRGWRQGCNWMWQVALKISWLTSRATYSVLTSYSRAFSPQICTILGTTGKTITKIFTQALLCCWDGQILSHQFLMVPECPTPFLRRAILTKLGTTLVMGNFSAPRALQLLVTTEKPIMPSPIERD